jgi:hypothetical protein
MKYLALIAALVLAPLTRADTLEVTFAAIFGGPFEPSSVGGTFLWDTVAERLSDPHITDSFGNDYSVISGARFATENWANNWHVGSLTGFTFSDPGVASIQLDYGNHAYLDTPLAPLPGQTYHTGGGVWFWNNIAGSSGTITVSTVPTPEPTTLAMLGSGLLCLFAISTPRRKGKAAGSVTRMRFGSERFRLTQASGEGPRASIPGR